MHLLAKLQRSTLPWACFFAVFRLAAILPEFHGAAGYPENLHTVFVQIDITWGTSDADPKYCGMDLDRAFPNIRIRIRLQV
jgi:hypothetical protein